MSFIAIIGSGTLGGTIAHKLAARDRVREVRLIDPEEPIAQGKALDIRQSSPIENFSARVVGIGSLAAVAGAGAIVIADTAKGEHTGEAGLALLRQIAALEASAPIVFAGAAQRDLMARAIGELRIAGSRIVGSAPFALESALRSLTGLSMDSSGVEIGITVVGVPPHAIAALQARLPGLWPPGPYALASAASRVIEAIVNGSRRRFTCFVAAGGGSIGAMPVELGEDGVRRLVEPVLTRQERTRLENAMNH